nr:hypothetical protein [Tanacetum cinerariifolium]
LPAMCLFKCQLQGYEFGKASGMAPRYEFSLCETKQVNIGWIEAFCVTLFVLKAKLNTFFGAFDLNVVLAPRIAHGALQEREIVNCLVTDGTKAWYASFGCAWP